MTRKLNLLLYFCLLFCITEGISQTVLIRGEKTSRSLTWDDFTGAPDHQSNLFAYTYWYVTYKWGPFGFSGDTVKWKVDVTLELEQRSWRKPDKVSDSLLAHEQGHFNIGLLFARTFRNRVNKTVFFRHDYERRIGEIFREELDRFREMETRYDRETRHFHDRVQQKKWDAYLKKELESTR